MGIYLTIVIAVVSAVVMMWLGARQTTDRNEPLFVPVISDGPKPLSSDGTIEVEVGGAVIRIGRTVTADLAVAVVQALQGSR